MQPAAATADLLAVVPAHERRAARTESYEALLARLARQSVVKHFDAYADIAWDAPEHVIAHTDPRWELAAEHPLGRTAWYRGLPQPIRARLGLHLIASQLKLGVEFERVLKQGLLGFAATLPHDAPELRYVYHEVIEEAHHSLMFRELLVRIGLEVPGLGWLDRMGSRRVARLGRTFPELFFLFVLGGEEPIDHAQRETLLSARDVHPLMQRVMRIHVTEEARHICFAREYLRHRVPRLTAGRRASLAIQAPLLLAEMVRQMMHPSAHVVRTYALPRAVVAEAYTACPEHRAFVMDSVAGVRELCDDLGLVTPWMRPLWRRLGLWAAARA
jgi:hypothetical protein